MNRMRRALLFMPGDSRRKIEKGAAMAVDSIIMDLEDAIALNQKEAARLSVADALGEVDFGRSEALVRINQVIRGWLYEEDIAATVTAKPDGYVLPKVEEAWQVVHVSEILAQAEERHGWDIGTIKLLAIIETAKGIVNLKEIAAADKRLDALVFGAEDLAGDIGATRTEEGYEVFYARSAVVTHAKAFGLQAIDTVFIDLTADAETLYKETEYIAKMGYTGKLAIHPKQVDPIQQVFTPKPNEIDSAQRLLEAFNAQQGQGIGVFEYEGKMIDMPMIRAALHILKRAQACGKIGTDVNLPNL
ncbi:MAG: CoA ester lyase [Anaerolineae bacterium]|nr:CoA ester lyase [Anaerolineae bacterium]